MQCSSLLCLATAGGEAVSLDNGEAVLPPSAIKKKPARPKEKGEKKVKKKVKTEKMDANGLEDEPLSLPQPAPNLDMHADILTHRDDDGVPDFPLPE
jgi:hypothetical protein